MNDLIKKLETARKELQSDLDEVDTLHILSYTGATKMIEIVKAHKCEWVSMHEKRTDAHKRTCDDMEVFAQYKGGKPYSVDTYCGNCQGTIVVKDND